MCKDNSRKTDCDDLLDALYEVADGDADWESRERLRAHADACPECLQQLGLEQQVRDLLRSCCSQPAPVELRARICTQLRLISYRVEE